MRVRFFPDCRAEAGGGHVSRCLAVAECVRERGGIAEFVVNDSAPWAVRLVEEKKFARYSTSEDAEAQSGSSDWVVIDDYTADLSGENAERRSGTRVMAFEDVPGRRHDCDVLVDPGGAPETAAEYYPLVPASAALFLGPRFAPLRPVFQAARTRQSDREPADQRRDNRPSVWIFFGRVDRGGFTLATLQAFSDTRFRGTCDLHLVITDTLTDASKVIAVAERLGAFVHEEIDDMAGFLSNMDMAVGAAGVGLWENCCLGVPSLGVAVAENQRRGLATAIEIGAAGELKCSGNASLEDIRQQIAEFLDDPVKRARMADAGRRAVDGAGALRIAALLNEIVIRPAAAGDRRLLWDWANDPAVRGNAMSGAQIPWDDHIDWFERKLNDPMSRIYIGCIGDVPVGQVRFDCLATPAGADIDISIASDWRGKGLGTGLLLQTEAAWRREFPNIRPVARVKRSNHSSLAVFRAAGYTYAEDNNFSDLLTLTTTH